MRAMAGKDPGRHRAALPGPRSAGPARRMNRPPAPSSAISVANFRADPLFPRIERAVAGLLARGRVVAPVDVLVSMGLLTRPASTIGVAAGCRTWSESSTATSPV